MKLSDYKNEDAVEVIADIIEPLSVIFTDEEIKNEKNKMKAIAKALKKYKCLGPTSRNIDFICLWWHLGNGKFHSSPSGSNVC